MKKVFHLNAFPEAGDKLRFLLTSILVNPVASLSCERSFSFHRMRTENFA